METIERITQGDHGRPGQPQLHRAGHSTAVQCAHDRAHQHRGASAGRARAGDAAVLERPKRRPPARMDGRGPRHVLPFGHVRDPADGFLFSGQRQIRRPGAAARIRREVASAHPGRPARYPAHDPRGPIRDAPLPAPQVVGQAHEHRRGLPQLPARVLPDCAPFATQRHLARCAPVVRTRCGARVAAARA
ncbi:uracil-DNA glycosylase [Bifidobacterium pseudolongum subsp. globosum]|nr:uracil-DNA glycosylase [Bifidobacterium pseudolongum subsp. globosum]